MYQKIEGELKAALATSSAADMRPTDPGALVAQLEAAQLSGNDDELRAVMAKLNASVRASIDADDDKGTGLQSSSTRAEI